MNGLWEALSHSLRALLDTHPLAVIGAVLFGEELGVPSPLPGDALMLLAGARARQGDFPLWAALVVQELATLAGTAGLYRFSRRFGRALVARYGWVLHLGPEQLARAEAAIGRAGGRAVALGRLIPGLRIATPIAAGTLGLPARTYLPAVAAGAFLYLLAFNLLGYWAGPAALAAFERLALPTGALLQLALVALCFALLRRVRRELPAFRRAGRGRALTARLDGVLAGVVALLATNGGIGVATFALRLAGHAVPTAAGAGGTGLHLLLGWPLFLAAAGPAQ